MRYLDLSLCSSGHGGIFGRLVQDWLHVFDTRQNWRDHFTLPSPPTIFLSFFLPCLSSYASESMSMKPGVIGPEDHLSTSSQ